MHNMRAHILTWLASVMAACIIGFAWIYTHPVQKFVTVNLTSLFSETAQQVARNKDESSLLMAQTQAKKIEQALQQLADGCDCLVMNSAAIAKRPGDGHGKVITYDMTDWVRKQISKP